MSEVLEDGGKDAQGNNLYAALARTMTRSAALYFSRPVRLFRPSKSMFLHIFGRVLEMIDRDTHYLS